MNPVILAILCTPPKIITKVKVVSITPVIFTSILKAELNALAIVFD